VMLKRLRKQKSSFLSLFPDEVLLHIFHFLSSDSVCCAELVCKHWFNIIHAEKTLQHRKWPSTRPARRQGTNREYRVTILGQGSVGKTALVVQYVQGNWTESYAPTIEDCYLKWTEIDGLAAVVDILDTAGPENYRALVESYMKRAEGFLIVFSVVNKASLAASQSFLRRIQNIFPDKKDIPFILVGNKIDLPDREVTFKMGMKTARKAIRAYLSPDGNKRVVPCSCNNFCEMSAKANTNVVKAFEELVKHIDEWRAVHCPSGEGVSAMRRRKRIHCVTM